MLSPLKSKKGAILLFNIGGSISIEPPITFGIPSFNPKFILRILMLSSISFVYSSF